MATTNDAPAHDEHAEHSDHAGEHGAHPSEAVYVKIALILAFLTAIEVGLYYREIGALNNIALLVLALAKFVLVAAYFMHLKFDTPVLRRFFVTGFILAALVYVAYLLTLGVFIGN